MDDPTPSDTEKAYGLLWAQPGSIGASASQARKLLLKAIGPDGQRRGIAWVQSVPAEPEIETARNAREAREEAARFVNASGEIGFD